MVRAEVRSKNASDERATLSMSAESDGLWFASDTIRSGVQAFREHLCRRFEVNVLDCIVELAFRISQPSWIFQLGHDPSEVQLW
jgi:hypothetical protein